MNDDEKDYTFAQTYGYESTGCHLRMISVVVSFYSNTLKIMLVDYSVQDMGWFDDYSYAAPRAKTMRGNGISTFLLHVSQCITLHKKKIVTETLISEVFLKSFYSRLGFKVIKYFATSPNFEEARKWFNYGSGKSRALQKQKLAYNVI